MMIISITAKRIVNLHVWKKMSWQTILKLVINRRNNQGTILIVEKLYHWTIHQRKSRPVVQDSAESSVEPSTTRNPGNTGTAGAVLDNAEELIKVKADMKVVMRNF